jgi:phosphatidylglycerophosphate synthase
MRSIADTYRLTKKTPDLPWNEYVCRPIAAVLVHGLAETRVTPNQVTLSALVVAAAAAALLVFVPGHVGLVVAVLVFEASYVLDCADGMLARLRNQQSTVGHLFDFLMDELKAFAMLAAASVRLWAEKGGDPIYLLVGLGGLVALASGIALTTFLRRPEIAGPPVASGGALAKKSVARRTIGAVESVAKFLIHYPSYIWLAALFDRLDWYLYAYVTVNTVYALRTLLGVAVRFGKPERV